MPVVIVVVGRPDAADQFSLVAHRKARIGVVGTGIVGIGQGGGTGAGLIEEILHKGIFSPFIRFAVGLRQKTVHGHGFAVGGRFR